MEKQKLLEIIKNAKVVRRPRGNPGGRSLYYKDVIAAFDIETTLDKDTNNAFMYVWGFGVNDTYITGRTWEEFIDLIKDIDQASKGAAVPVYVHNLSYEFVFLSGVLDFKPWDVICGKKREIIKAYYEPLEFRCSYKLTGMSLEALTREYNVINKKLDGSKYDYSIARYPWTNLNDYEREYLHNDVMGLIEVIKKQMAVYSDTIYNIPITKNGYVRRQLKKRMRTYPWEYVNKQKIDLKIYKMLNIAMRGGLVHANRYYSGEIIKGPGVDSWDISSAYPAAIIYGRFPMGKWKIIEPNLDDLIEYMFIRDKAILTTLKFTNIRLKNEYDPFPYITKNKSLISDGATTREDNGRIMEVNGALIGTFSDIDLKIIFFQYDWDDVEILELATNKYGPLPNQIKEYVLELYEQKTKLKGLDKKDLYSAIKTEINGLFGTLAEDPGKLYYTYNDGVYEPSGLSREELIELKDKAAAEKIQKSNLPYTWGVWVPAIVRGWVQSVLDNLGDSALYVDTDGIKVFGGVKGAFIDFNALIDDFSAGIQGTSVPDNDGVIHTLGAWEYEGHYEEFITMGTKKYAYKENGEVKITTAGVNKIKGGRELGSLENYHEGFTFYEAGGSEAIYNDNADFYIEREGHKLHITRNVALIPSTFTLGLTEEYRRLMGLPKVIDYVIEKMEEKK